MVLVLLDLSSGYIFVEAQAFIARLSNLAEAGAAGSWGRRGGQISSE